MDQLVQQLRAEELERGVVGLDFALELNVGGVLAFLDVPVGQGPEVGGDAVLGQPVVQEEGAVAEFLGGIYLQLGVDFLGG